MVQNDIIKRCTKCRVEYCIEEFYIRRDRDSHSSWCKFCVRDAQNERGVRKRESQKRLFEAGKIKPISEKWCLWCDEVKPWQEFYMKYDASDLLSHYCRMCHMRDNRSYKRRRRVKKKPIFCYEMNSMRMDRHLQGDDR